MSRLYNIQKRPSNRKRPCRTCKKVKKALQNLCRVLVSCDPEPIAPIVPNGLYWPIIPTTDHDLAIKIWEQFLELGANSVPLCGHDYQVDGVLTSRTDNAYVDNYLQVQEELGNVPIQMQANVGRHHFWEGVDDGPTILQRRGESMFADEHLEVYHDCVPDVAVDGAGLKSLVRANYYSAETTSNYINATRAMHCPGYRGAVYQAALDKLGEACKWYKPVAVHGDSEYYKSANWSDQQTERVLWGRGNYPSLEELVSGAAAHKALAECSRCGNKDGYVANIDSMGWGISSRIRQYVPDAMICEYGVHAQHPGISRYNQNLWAYGESTGYTTGMYPLYELTCDSSSPIDNRTLFTDPVARYKELIELGPLPIRRRWYWPGAPRGAYVYFCQRMDAGASTGDANGYQTDQMMYDICYYMAQQGAAGFALYPGYSGKDQDPIKYPPGSASYTASQMASDSAAKRLLPVMHEAFAAGRC